MKKEALKQVPFALIFLLTLFLGLKLSILQSFGTNFETYPGDYVDVRFINCIMEHNWQWLIGNVDGIYNGHFMYPDLQTITYSDNLLGNLPVYAVFRAIGISVHHSLQGWLIATVCLNFILGFIGFRYFLKNKWLSLLAAFLFTFSLAVIGQYVHIQMTARYMIPLFFMFLMRFFETKSNKWFFFAGLSLVWQFYLSVYMGFLLLYSGTIVAAVMTYFNRHEFKTITKKNIGQLTISVLVNAGLLFALLFPYMERLKTTPYAYYKEIAPTIPTFGSYLRPFFGTEFWPFLDFGLEQNTVNWLHVLFPGGLIVLALLTIPITYFFSKNKLFLLLSIFTCLIFASFLQINGYSLFAVIRKIPGFGSIRIGTRIINILIFFFALLTAFSVKLWFAKKTETIVAVVAVLLLSLSFFDQRNNWKACDRTRISTSNGRVKRLTAEIKSKYNPQIHKAFAITTDSLNMNEFNILQLDAMLASYRLNIKTVNGYSSFASVIFYKFWNKPDKKHLEAYLLEYGIEPEQILILER
jgi:hypothetical protein